MQSNFTSQNASPLSLPSECESSSIALAALLSFSLALLFSSYSSRISRSHRAFSKSCVAPFCLSFCAPWRRSLSLPLHRALLSLSCSAFSPSFLAPPPSTASTATGALSDKRKGQARAGQGFKRFSSMEVKQSVLSSGAANQVKEVPRIKKRGGLCVEGYPVEGISIGGQETCIIFPTMKLAFDIGRCPQRAISQDFLFISHGHMDHIGGLPMYVATRGLYSMKPPTIFVPSSLKEHVENLFNVHRAMDQSELKHNLIGLNIGEEYQIRKDLRVKAFKTYHVIPSQGYVIYTVKQKLKQEFIGLSGEQIKQLKLSGVEITDTISTPEIAFTGDTMSDFILDPDNFDVLKSRILVMESTFVDNAMSIEHAREFGHTHLFEIVSLADRFQNKAILLIHFSARYRVEEIEEAISKLPSSFSGRVFVLTEGI